MKILMDNEMRARLDGKQLVLTCAKFFTADQREREIEGAVLE